MRFVFYLSLVFIYFSPCLGKIVTDFEIVEEAPANGDSTIDTEKIMLFFPKSINGADTDYSIRNKIFDKSLQSFLSGKLSPNAKIFKTVKAIENTMRMDVNIPSDSKSDINHRFGFVTQPFQQIFAIKYSGLADASVDFHAQGNVKAKIDHSLSSASKLRLEYKNANRDKQSTVNMLWNW